MKIEWEQRVAAQTFAPLALVAECCQAVEGVEQPLSVHVVLTDDADIRTVNAEYRGIDRSTDVLSFPTVNYPKGKTARHCAKRLHAEYDPETGACMLGDILISYEHAMAQAEEYGHSVHREMCYLFAHGLFHLMGYDHMEEDEKKEMRAMEEKALHMAGISREDSAAPITNEELLDLARIALKNAYAPYSKYRVGAALLATSGRVYLGCNIENASFGLTNCAERTALFKAASEGEHEFEAIAIATDGTSAPYPCGACRQVLSEFAPHLRVLVTWGDEVEATLLSALLPYSFGPKSLLG